MSSDVFSALEISAAVRSRRITARAVVEQALEKVHATQGRLNAFTEVTAERARAEAAAVDAALSAG